MKFFWPPHFFTTKRGYIILAIIVLFLVLGLTIPSHFVLAFNWGIFNPVNWLESAAKAVVNGLIMVIFTILSVIATAFLQLSQIIFQWVTSDSFIRLSFTGPDNNIVQMGWKMMRNFADAGLLLGLVFIGLATTFNMAGYNTKKTLLRLLVVALLINFTPLICGAIIDGANFFTTYFLHKAPTLAEGWGQKLADQLGTMKGDLLGNPGAVFAKATLILAFDVISTFIFFLYAALFAFRYVVLWVLIIFSPLAFLTWAFSSFSAMKKIFERWWFNFLNWSFIGVPAAFMLYLSDQALSIAKSGKLIGTSTDLHNFAPGFADSVAVYGVPAILLIIGLVVSVSSSAEGSSFIIGKAKSWGKTAGKASLALGGLAGMKIGRGAINRTMGSMTGAKTGWRNQTKKWKKPFSFAKGSLTGAFNEAAIEQGRTTAESWMTRKGKSPFGYAQRIIGRATVRATRKSEQNEYEQAQKKAEKYDLSTNASRYQSAGTLGRLAIVANAVKQGNLGKLVKKANISPEEAKKLYAASIRLRDEDTQKALERQFAADNGEAFGAIAQKLGKYTVEQQTKDRVEKGYTSYTAKIIAEAKDAKAIKQLAPSLGKAGQEYNLQARNIHEAIHRFWQGKQVEQAVDTLGKKFADSFQENTKPMDWYLQVDENTGRPRNAPLAFYLNSTAAQKSGVGFKENVTLKDLKKELAKNQEVARTTGENIRAQAQERGGFVINPKEKPVDSTLPPEEGMTRRWQTNRRKSGANTSATTEGKVKYHWQSTRKKSGMNAKDATAKKTAHWWQHRNKD